MSEWGSFVDETPRQPSVPPAPPKPAVSDEWGSFADEPVADGEGLARPVTPPRPALVSELAPEIVASLLTAGETLWAQVDGYDAVLGSGCRVSAVYDGDEPDGFSGWRPVTVIDPAALTVRPVPLALARPAVGAAISVAELFTEQATADPETAPLFPVGGGPDVPALLARAVDEERERVRVQAQEAARKVEAALAEAERGFVVRAEAAEREARTRESQAAAEIANAESRARDQVRQTQEEAQRQIAAARHDAGQMVQQWVHRAQVAEAATGRLRNHRVILGASLGGLVVAILVILILNGM